ncbi:MAG: response regulator transcription factor [Colwellia sp.]|nr:response regulator transcription factor [Colwellia sp.]
MIKLTAMIIDDEPLAHEIILDYLTELPFVEVIHQAYNAIEALGYLNQQQVDLLFLDINMPKLSGIDFLKVLNNKPQVIITSAYRQYALESFDLDVCDYLLKPYRFERFLKAVNKAHQQFQFKKEDVTNAVEETKSKTLFIKVDKKLIQLAIDQISFLEAYGNYVKVWVNDKVYLTPRTLISFEKELVSDNEEFLRIHKSYIVQKSQIISIENKIIEMNNQQQIPVGKSYKHMIKLIKGS